MKRNILRFIILLTVLGLVTIQSCKKDEVVKPTDFVAAMPEAPAPAVNGIIARTVGTQTVNLTWNGTATNAITWDVYFGKTSHPSHVGTATTNAYTASVTTGGKYYWQVVTTDNHGVESDSPVWSFQVNSDPTAATTPAPANSAVNVSATLSTLTWVGADPEGDDLTYDVSFGTSATPPPVASGLTSASYTLASALAPNTLYYWSVVTHDPFGGKSTSPVWSFTTGAAPVNTFVGNFNADEPAESYSYGVSFTMVNSTTIKTTNYWNSGWTGTFTLDFTKKIYTMPFTQFTTTGNIWTGIESGSINTTTGKMQGTYTIWKNGVISEQGVHTYTKLP